MFLTTTLGANLLVTTLMVLFVLVCLFMMLVILIQKPKGGGLSGAFGGAGGSAQAAFGAKTGDLLTTITIGCFITFLGLAIALTYAIRDDVAPKIATPVPAVTTTSNPADQATNPLDQEAAAPAEAAGEVDAHVEPAPAESTDAQPQTTEPDAQP